MFSHFVFYHFRPRRRVFLELAPCILLHKLSDERAKQRKRVRLHPPPCVLEVLRFLAKQTVFFADSRQVTVSFYSFVYLFCVSPQKPEQIRVQEQFIGTTELRTIKGPKLETLFSRAGLFL